MNNFCEIEGHLGQDPKQIKTESTEFWVLNVAQNKSKKLSDGSFKELTPEWFEVSVFGKIASQAKQLKKGNRVRIEGRLTNLKKTIDSKNISFLKIDVRKLQKIESLTKTAPNLEMPSFEDFDEKSPI